MKQKKGNSTQQEPLRKWLIGDATRHDERALEAQAKADPFLADAIEGYRSLPEGDHAADVTKLKARLRQKTERNRSAGFYLLRIAAVGAVLVAAWLVLQQFPSNEKSVAATEAKQPAAEVPAAEMAAPALDSTENSLAWQEEKEQLRTKNLPASHLFSEPEKTTADAQTADLAQSNTEVEVKESEPVADVIAPPPPVTLDKPASKPAPSAATEGSVAMDSPKPAARKDEDSAKAGKSKTEAKKRNDAATNAPGVPPARTITGKVTDENGDPLIGASVQVFNSSQGTSTDTDGNYSLALPAGTEILVFSYTGYVQLQISLGNSNKLNVQLADNDLALSEVVVTGYSQTEEKVKEEDIVSPRPEGGFKQFKQYVAENMRHPEANKQPRPKQTVRVRFTIEKDGSLSGFSPKGNAPQAYKDEAVRLLREGPRWKSSAHTAVSYRFNFE